MRFIGGIVVATSALVCVAGVAARGAEPSPITGERLEFFEKRIRPLLVEHCYECHAADAEEIGGGLRLDRHDTRLAGGDSGPAVVPGKPEASLLVRAVRYDDDGLQMPPGGKLKPEAIADLVRWVAEGAVSPATETAPAKVKAAASWDDTLRERRQWWSLQAVQRPEIPPPADEATGNHPIDRFLAERRKAGGLEPAGPADPYALVRRTALVLTGLPPTASQIEAFVASRPRSLRPSVSPSGDDNRGTERPSDDDDAFEALTDDLLASPAFGERWARHWFDVVRFSETHGNEWNYEVHHAWRYRDYVIRALNADVPYDQFVREHIAGDLLATPRRNAAEQFNESVIGTAFYRFGEVSHDDCIGLRGIGYDIVDNQLDTLTKAFQATTVACARCHDHKIDAVSTKDYYALLGILRSSRSVSHTIDEAGVNEPTIERLAAIKARLRPILAEAWRRDGEEIAGYLRAAAGGRHDVDPKLDPARVERWRKTLAAEPAGPDDPLGPLRTIVKESAAGKRTIAEIWKTSVDRYREKDRATAGVELWADFRTDEHGWEVGGQGFRPVKGNPGRGSWATTGGELVVATDGERLVADMLPAGHYTHALSDRLNGTLRSPPLPAGGKYVSFRIAGRGSAAVRLVSNNCQLNYKNYRALTSDELTWVTFPIPEERDELRNYVELMTLLDNPKFPDQLSALGGDKKSYRLPWDEAAGDRRSYFGVTKAIVHDESTPPVMLDHLGRLFEGPTPDDWTPKSMEEAAERYEQAFAAALEAWTVGRATDDDVPWIAPLVRHGLVRNTVAELPEAGKLVDAFRRAESELREPQIVPGLGDFGSGTDQAVLIRGDWRKPGPIAPRGYLEALDAEAFGRNAGTTLAGSGRKELAERIASAGNPLTARVYVNRIWHHLFGSGLVRTVDDFGRLGELPSHPELLDYLAARFVEEGWSTKKLIRLIVTSRAFQAAAAPSAAALATDPDNRLLSYYPARRLEAEAVRDLLLAASGRLDTKLYGPSVQPYREKANADRRLFPGPLDGGGRRSVYVKCNLMESPKFLGAFNLPGGKVTQGRRDTSQAPAQALALLNDPLVLAQAEYWAERLCDESSTPLDERVAGMIQRAYGRPASAEERASLVEMIGELAKLHGVVAKDVAQSRIVWRDAAHALFLTEEFVFIP
jgi:hypothetical protein